MKNSKFDYVIRLKGDNHEIAKGVLLDKSIEKINARIKKKERRLENIHPYYIGALLGFIIGSIFSPIYWPFLLLTIGLYWGLKWSIHQDKKLLEKHRKWIRVKRR